MSLHNTITCNHSNNGFLSPADASTNTVDKFLFKYWFMKEQRDGVSPG